MASKANANKRRKIAKNPAVAPELRWYLQKLNKKTAVWGTTSTTTTTTTTTT